jgi:hypothetical protein
LFGNTFIGDITAGLCSALKQMARRAGLTTMT